MYKRAIEFEKVIYILSHESPVEVDRGYDPPAGIIQVRKLKLILLRVDIAVGLCYCYKDWSIVE